MAFVEQFLKQNRITRVADRLRNQTVAFLKQRSNLANIAFPLQEKGGIDWLEYVVEQTDPIASIVAPAQEYPSWQGNQFSRVADRLPKAALAYFWNEDTLRKAREVSEYGGNVMQGRVEEMFVPEEGVDMRAYDINSTDAAKFENLTRLLFGSQQQLIRSHFNIIDLMAYSLLQTGKIEYVDFRTKRKLVYDWRKVVPTIYNHFPDVDRDMSYFAPDGDKNIANHATRDWTVWDSADGIEDITAAARIYHEDSGIFPSRIEMSSLCAYHLVRQEATKRAVVDNRIVGEILRGAPTLEMVNVILRSKGLPAITLNDDQFTLDDGQTTSVRTRQRFLDPTVFVFAIEGMGDRVFGGTMENNDRGGIYVNTRQKSAEPPLDVTVAVSSPLAVCTTIARTGLSRKVTTRDKIDESINIKDYLYDA